MQMDRTIKALRVPVRAFKILASGSLWNVEAKVVRMFNKRKGNRMLAHISKATHDELVALEQSHRRGIDAIHDKYNAPEPTHYFLQGRVPRSRKGRQ